LFLFLFFLLFGRGLKGVRACSLSRGRLSHVGGLGYDFGDHAVECVRDNMAVIQILG
jgi:hypothetical protein